MQLNAFIEVIVMDSDSLKDTFKISFQVYINTSKTTEGKWHNACVLTFRQPNTGDTDSVLLEYEALYVSQFLNDPSASISLHYPVDFYPHLSQKVPAFLQDMMPKESDISFDFLYECKHLLTPKGNIRIAIDDAALYEAQGFNLQNIAAKEIVAQEISAQENDTFTKLFKYDPRDKKPFELYVSEAEDGLYYPEHSLADERIKQSYWVKCIPNNGNQIDHLMLEAEACFYKIADALGFNSIDLESMKFIPRNEDASFAMASLWLPRFDCQSQVINTDSTETHYGIERYGIESLDALARATQGGSEISHKNYLSILIQFWCKYEQEEDIQEMVIEYLQRDLLNVVLGNAGLNGKNTWVLRKHGELMLAPIVDLAPRAMAEESVMRTACWDEENEQEGKFNWRGICKEVSIICLNTANLTLDFELLWQELQQCAQGMREIPRLAEEFGLADEVSRHPKINLAKLDEKLKEWELI